MVVNAKHVWGSSEKRKNRMKRGSGGFNRAGGVVLKKK